MNSGLYQERIPSESLGTLAKLNHAKISRLTRYSWLSKAEAVAEWNLSPSQVFTLAAGPLIITLDTGLIIGFASLPSQASVSVWTERTETGESDPELMTENDAELFPIEADDPIYSQQELAALIGREVTGAKLLKLNTEKALLKAVPKEVGIVLTFENGTELILSHGLHDESDDFSVLLKSQIDGTLYSSLTELVLIQ